MADKPNSYPALFGDASIDHAIAGLGAGTVATLVMHPLDLVKVRFQLATIPYTVQSSSTAAVAGSSGAGAAISAVPTPTVTPLLAPSPSATASTSTPANPITSSTKPTPHPLRPIFPTALGSSSHSIPNPSPPMPQSQLLPLKRHPLGTNVYHALKSAVTQDGWLGLYRGLGPNLVGGAGSWGLYFLFYNIIKQNQAIPPPSSGSSTSTASSHLLAAAEASAITAMLTNPIWVVKTRVFASSRRAEGGVGMGFGAEGSGRIVGVMGGSSSVGAVGKGLGDERYKGLWSELRKIYRTEGIRGLYRGSALALVGVSNGSIQFAAYEEIKRSRTARKRAKWEAGGGVWERGMEKLSNMEYILASGTSKLVAIALTYPYQVVRARIQNPATSHIYSSIPATIRITFQREGFLAFYKGLGTNALRILPGTCTTFVVYENLVWAFREVAGKRAAERELRG